MSAVSLVRRIALPGFALLLLWGCAGHERPVSAPQMSQPRAPRELRVMTFNLRVRTILDGLNIWDLRRELVVQRVRAFDPHLLGTQEGLASMEAFLREQFGDYTFFGVGRSDGKRRGEMCGVFFKTAASNCSTADTSGSARPPRNRASAGVTSPTGAKAQVTGGLASICTKRPSSKRSPRILNLVRCVRRRQTRSFATIPAWLAVIVGGAMPSDQNERASKGRRSSGVNSMVAAGWLSRRPQP